MHQRGHAAKVYGDDGRLYRSAANGGKDTALRYAATQNCYAAQLAT